MAHSMGFICVAVCLAALHAASALAVEGGTTRSGDVEMHCVALPTSELTPEAAKEFNVVQDPQRGLLTISVFRHVGPGQTQSQQAQIYAGAINAQNQLLSIPVREVKKGSAVYYLGEFRVTTPDTLRFLVNANAAHGKPLKVEFSRAFGAP
jgi:hypothetical protein